MSRLAALAVLLPATLAAQPESRPMRVGIIGLDTSHVVAFTRAMNAPDRVGALARLRVVAAYPGGSPDLPASRDRIEGFTAKVRAMGVAITPDIPSLLERVDAVLLESVDGRPHLEQIRPVLEKKLPVFVDKPVAGSLRDAIEIYRLAVERGVPIFSSSALRFSPGIAGMGSDPRVGAVTGCSAFGPCPLEPHHPDLFWYGIHGVEVLFTIMGPGCERVSRVHTEDSELVTGVWSDGRIGTFRGLRAGKSDYGALVFGTAGIARSGGYAGYAPLVEQIAIFFVTGEAPVSADETLEIYTFMAAADESARRGGKAVSLAEVRRAATAGR